MKKNSPYRIFFNKGILDLIGNGALQLYKQRNSEMTIDCNISPEEGESSDFFKTASIFLILFIGAILSIFFLSYESFKKPEDITNSLSEEKMNLYYNQIYIMAKNFENTDVQDLREICQIPDFRFFTTSKKENF